MLIHGSIYPTLTLHCPWITTTSETIQKKTVEDANVPAWLEYDVISGITGSKGN